MSNPTESWGEETLVGGEQATGPTQAWDEATLAGGEPPNQRTRPSPDRRPVERGAAIGRYLILSTLGAGGMGVVYAAYDPELDRKVALKLLRADGAGTNASEGRTRLLREAQALAKLAHPNVVAIHDVGTHGDEVFLAMEFVDGQPLGDWAKAKPRTWREKLSAVVEAGRGVAAAHAAGLLHRDLKPDNIMVAADGRVRVMDLGLARAQAVGGDAVKSEAMADTKASPELAALAVRVTQAGAIMGTPAYMAPEQFRGAEVGTAADQFALCVTAWELLAGARPYSGETLMELAANVLTGKRSPAPRRTDVPRWVWPILERGLAAEPSQRWPSIEALLNALERGQARARSRRVLAGVAIAGLAAAGVAGWRELDERQRIAACEAEGATIEQTWNDAKKTELREALLATGVSYAAVTADKVTPWFDAQAQAWAQARTDACLAANVERTWDADTLDRATWCLDERQMELAALIAELSRPDAEVVQRAVGAAAGLAPTSVCLDAAALRRLPAQPSDRDAIQAVRDELSRAGALEAAARYELGLETAEAALALAETAGWPPLHAAAQLSVARLLERLGRYPDAEAASERAYFEAGSVGALDVAANAGNLLIRLVGDRQAQSAHGRRWGQHAAMMLELLDEPETSLRRADMLLGLAYIHANEGNYPEAEALGERVLSIYEAALGPEHPNVAMTLNHLAIVHRRAGDPAKAKALYERALGILTNALGPEHPEIARTLNNYATVFRYSGDYADAKALYERALGVQERSLGLEHPVLADTLENLATVYAIAGAHAEAKPLFERTLAIRERALGPEHPTVAATLSNLGGIYAETGDLAEAEALHGRALAIQEKVLGPEHPDLAHTLLNLAILQENRGARAEAKPLYERALAITEKALGPDSPALAHPLIGLTEIALAEGRPADAVVSAERAVTLMAASDAPTEELAQAHYGLARGLWDAPVGAGRDRARAVELATQARDAWRGLSRYEVLFAEAERWLAEHPAP